MRSAALAAPSPLNLPPRAPRHSTSRRPLALACQTVLRTGPVTSCDAPEGPYVFVSPSVLLPDCPRALHPSAPPGAARCAMLAADAFERVFSLRKHLGIVTATTQPS
jgi:hypothetical protein